MRRVRIGTGVVAASVALALAAAVMAKPAPLPTAIVSMGDSFVSGEGGGSYGASARNGCDRSAMAPIRSAPIDVDDKVNLACSGAKTENIWRAASGGKSHRGEPPQADQLATVARHFDVELVVLTVGANDLGFAGIVADCALDWARSSPDDPRYCHSDAQRKIEEGLSAAIRDLRKAIHEIRAAMASAGQDRDDYRLIVMGYASPFPAGDQIRYPESGWTRLTEGGCPVWNADADWAKRVALPTIAAMMQSAAAAKGADYLDLQQTLEGHEVCAKATEWFRPLSLTDGPVRESLHPNPIGQRVVGRCLAFAWGEFPDRYVCGPGGEAISSTR
jgi:lysophospholipase L1-like esterase